MEIVFTIMAFIILAFIAWVIFGPRDYDHLYDYDDGKKDRDYLDD